MANIESYRYGSLTFPFSENSGLQHSTDSSPSLSNQGEEKILSEEHTPTWTVLCKIAAL